MLRSVACERCDTSAEGGDGTITISRGVSDFVPGRGSPTQGKRPGVEEYFYVREFLAPTCNGNGLHNAETLCTSAVTSCRVIDQVRFWVWHQRVDVVVGPPEVVRRGDWRQERGTFCLGPDDAGVPSIVRTLAAARALFERRIRELDPPTIQTVPGPRTLVHYPTRFTAGGAGAFTDDVRVAGATVRLHVRPESYRWVLGDGTARRTNGPSTTHTYDVRARRTIRVDVTWGGWFTVNGGSERYDIDPPATSTGRPGLLTVVEARAENVA
jgi:hypothetical protein